MTQGDIKDMLIIFSGTCFLLVLAVFASIALHGLTNLVMRKVEKHEELKAVRAMFPKRKN